MDRKKLVKLLGEHFGVRPRYLGAPSFAYEIEIPKDIYTIDREGRIMTSAGEEIELEELIAGPEESISYELEIPMDGHSGRTLRNIINMIYSRQSLIKKALNIEENIVEEDFVIKINEADIKSIDSLERAMKDLDATGHPGIKFNFQDKTIIFKYTGTEAATWLFALINKNAKVQKRALAKVKPTDNEKYTFRTWLTRLGMVGDEYKEIRKELLQNLSGNSAYRRGENHEA
ncbi:virulence-related protein [Tissierella praeacuta]|uniref:virulence-related protein n=1 Tax=Tissierella praeacuta TaxID=43131 RepID=UPI003519AD40